MQLERQNLISTCQLGQARQYIPAQLALVQDLSSCHRGAKSYVAVDNLPMEKETTSQ